MEIQRKCLWCGKPFIAHTMVTRYCCKSCTGKAYKARKRKEQLQQYEKQQTERPIPKVEPLEGKAFLLPDEVAVLLNISRATVYRHMASGAIRALQLRGRTIIRRKDIERMFDENPDYKVRHYGRKQTALLYSTNEVLEKYHITKKALFRRCKLYGIPKIEQGCRVFYNRALIDKYFADLIEEISPDLYYTPDEVMEKYGMTRAAVAAFAMRHNIPRINRHHEAYYSRAHIDAVKEKLHGFNPDYYTFKEIQEKFGLTAVNISYYVNKYNVDRFRQGSKTLVSRKAFDRLMHEKLGK